MNTSGHFNFTEKTNFTEFNRSDWPLCEGDFEITEYDNYFRLIIHGVLLNAIGAAGLLGNALSILVLSRPHMRSSINCLLIGLAACDTVLILTSVMLFGLTAIYPYTGYMKYYYYYIAPHVTPLVFPIALIAQTMSVYLTLTVTVERWVAVCHPFRARALCTSSRARWYVFGTAVFSLIYNIPRFFETEVVEVVVSAEEVVYCIQPAQQIRNETYKKVYIHWIYLVVMYIVPFTALAALNVCIVRQVRRAQLERARLSRVQRRELSLATMLVVVVLVFFVCNLLPLITNAVEAFFENQFEIWDSTLVKTSNFLVTVNSSVNFIIYVIFGEKFKRVFLKMFCRGKAWGGRGESPDHTRDESSNGDHMTSLRGISRRSTGSKIRSGKPPPVVYYPDHELTSLTAVPTNNHSWKNGHTENEF